jgi:flagellar basal-body rod modification protein FlgD
MSVSGVTGHNNATQTDGSQNTSNASTDSSLQSIESTFLTLLVQELQNQDPTAPMDSTQMVGQMISLNQLDQLASINQVVTNALGSSSTAVDGGTSGS